MHFDKPDHITDFVRERTDSASGLRMRLAERSARYVAYYCGLQWAAGTWPSGGVNTTSGIVLQPNVNPDTTRLRVTQNETTKYIVTLMSATYPYAFDPSIDPPTRDAGVTATVRAQTLEDALYADMRRSGLVEACREANAMRSIFGAYGVGFTSTVRTRKLRLANQEVDVQDSCVKAHAFDPLRLVLDPAQTSHDLRRHDDVVYQDVWTEAKVRRVFPDVKIDSDELMTFAQLASNEIEASRITGGNVFQWYAHYAKSKGCRVYQIHKKDETGRFRWFYAGIESKPGKIEWVNFDSPETIWGGDGLPMVLISGHPRPGSWVGISDVAMIEDDQNLVNLMRTWSNRVWQMHSGYKWLADKRWFTKNASDEDVEHRFNNQVGGVIWGTPGSQDRNAMPPQLVPSPAPDPNIGMEIERANSRMGEKVFRSPESRGLGAKTHVPFQTTNRLINEGDRVLSIRVQNDIIAYQQLLMVQLGTVVRGVREQNPTTLAMLSEEGFDEEDFVVMMNTDPNMPACAVRLPESSVRYRSTAEKKEDLYAAAQAQVLPPDALAMGLAEIDSAITEQDRDMRQKIEKHVAAIVRGEEWEAIPLGPRYAEWFVSTCRRAILDRQTRRSPGAKERLAEAIVTQAQFEYEMMAMMQPEQGQQPQPEQAQPEQAQVPQTMAELVGALVNEGGMG